MCSWPRLHLGKEFDTTELQRKFTLNPPLASAEEEEDPVWGCAEMARPSRTADLVGSDERRLGAGLKNVWHMAPAPTRSSSAARTFERVWACNPRTPMRCISPSQALSSLDSSSIPVPQSFVARVCVDIPDAI